jgi:transketolase
MSNGLGDRFVLSKGHAALGLYCALEEFGQIPHRRLAEFGRSGARLEPHPNAALEPAVHASTGSLGQGLSIAAGMALGSRLQDRADRTFVIIGDGEANEGQIWEAARSAAFLRLSNLVVLLDENQLQQDGRMEDILPVTDLAAAWEGMGWRCTSTDGHDVEALDGALSELLACEGQPKLLCARSIKGKGVPFLEGRPESHYPPPLSADDLTLVRYLIEAGSKNE